MDEKTVTAILWTLVAVCLVCWFTGLVSKATDESLWSHVQTPTRQQPHWRYP